MKSLLKKVNLKEEAFREALFFWRLTPRADGFSPAHGFFGRHVRSRWPNAREHAPPICPEFVSARQQSRDAAAMAAGGSEIVSLSPGDHVLFQSPIDKNWSRGGRVIERLPHGRSYLIETPGGIFRRNHRFLRFISAPSPDVSDTLTTSIEPFQKGLSFDDPIEKPRTPKEAVSRSSSTAGSYPTFPPDSRPSRHRPRRSTRLRSTTNKRVVAFAKTPTIIP
ncbi:hypothetical protein TCAL_14403 [Tigriopus californicus]|uniref:Uncharacterized protein n=1 Tax=Tigriopus californicus TaxID=6832 RepID=A0A553PKA4_TIGCA|nr:hypothetical protein TCAL_14403 [Tigriopus californicus]